MAGLFASQENVRVGWVADANKQRLQAAAQGCNGHRPKLTDDMRKFYDDPAVDAVIVAAPDHWHTPAAILACDAGKHVEASAESLAEDAASVTAATRCSQSWRGAADRRVASRVGMAAPVVR